MNARLFLIFFFIMVVMGNSHAEDIDSYDTLSVGQLKTMSLEELLNIQVTTSSRKPEKMEDAPNNIYVITKEQIRQRGYTCLKDVLQQIPGFGVFHRDLDFVTQFRGIAPNGHNKVTYMINGQSINNLTETSLLNGPINLEAIERIEIIAGPGSVLYGSETLLATVNLIMEGFTENEVIVRTGQDLSEGSNFGDFRTLSAVVGNKWENGNYIKTSLTFYEMQGWDAWDSVYKKNLPGTTLTGKIYPSYFLNADMKLDDWKMMFVSYNLDQSELNIYKDYNKANGHRHDNLDLFNVSRDIKLSEKIASTMELGYKNQRYLRTNTEGIAGSYDLSQKVFRAEYGITTRIYEVDIAAGVQAQEKIHRNNYTYYWSPDDPAFSDTSSFIKSIVRDVNTNVIGGYVSAEYFIHEKVKLIAAIRGDRDNIVDDEQLFFSPRFSLIYKPIDNLTTKLLFNKATKMPDPWFSRLNRIWGKGNPNSPAGTSYNTIAKKPETYTAYEWQTIYHPGQEGLFVVKTNIYYHQLNDFIAWYRPFTNIGDFTGYGAELEVQTFVREKDMVWFNVSYNQNDFVLTADTVSGTIVLPINDEGNMIAAPPIMANIGADINVLKNLYFSTSFRYFTNQPAKDLDNKDVSLGDRYYLDASLSYYGIVKKGIYGRVSCRNILNNQQLVNSQFHVQRYHPRGTAFDVTLGYTF